MLRVAVKLPATIGEVGEYLADVTALEAAGADAIWVDDSELEPSVLLGAIAAVTHRVGLGCLLAQPGSQPSMRVESVTALQKLSRGRIIVGLSWSTHKEEEVAALRATGAKILAAGSEPGRADGVIYNVESAGQLSPARDTDIEVWALIAFPPDREAWARTKNAYQSVGAAGVIVPWDPRVVDLLRNPDADDRTDLLIATG